MNITVTPDNLKEYVFHKHDVREIVCYISGTGEMQTSRGNIPFEKGTILILPPNLLHRSVSEDGFKNVCVHIDDFSLANDSVLIGKDNRFEDAQTLAKMLTRAFADTAAGGKKNFLCLYNAYRETVLELIEKSSADKAATVKEELVNHFSDASYGAWQALQGHDLSPDHLRALFKKKYGCSPLRYLTQLRISAACHLFDVYGDKIKVREAAYMSGFDDELYFSRKFKEEKGVSPKTYKKERAKNT